MQESIDRSSIVNRDSHDTETPTYARTYDTDYAYDLSRRTQESIDRSNVVNRSDTFNEIQTQSMPGGAATVAGVLPDFESAVDHPYLPEPEDRDLFAGGRPEPKEKDGAGGTGRSGMSAEDSKHIYLEVNGGGRISISPTTDRAEVLEILEENLRPVLVGIIQQEIFEEGDGSYEF